MKIARERKPVVLKTPDETHSFEYWSQIRDHRGRLIVLASDSLNKLKEELKLRRQIESWISCKTGSFSYGQNIVSEYLYRPNFNRKKSL